MPVIYHYQTNIPMSCGPYVITTYSSKPAFINFDVGVLGCNTLDFRYIPMFRRKILTLFSCPKPYLNTNPSGVTMLKTNMAFTVARTSNLFTSYLLVEGLFPCIKSRPYWQPISMRCRYIGIAADGIKNSKMECHS